MPRNGCTVAAEVYDALKKIGLARGRPYNGSTGAEVRDALEKLGGIKEEYVKLLPKALRVRGFSALCDWKRRNPKEAASMTEMGQDAARRNLCYYVTKIRFPNMVM